MRSLVRLAWVAVAVAFGEVLLGSWTRINGAGLTCPDYPLCRGKLIPAMNGGVIWEWSHRFTALALSILVIAVVIAAWRAKNPPAYLRASAIVVASLFFVQLALGAATVRLGNSPVSVVWHWGTAMALIASLAALALFAQQKLNERADSGDASAASVLGAAALIAFATMCIGAYVSSSGAGLACLSLPGCAGNVVPAGEGQFVQMLHRFAAAASLLASVAAFTFVWVKHSSARVRFCTTAALALVFVQIILGLLNVALRLPLQLREAHAANAALIFLFFACATTLAVLDSARSGERLENA